MLAWLVGMTLIFWGLDRFFMVGLNLSDILMLTGVLLLAGVVVGVIHDLFLAAMVEKTEG